MMEDVLESRSHKTGGEHLDLDGGNSHEQDISNSSGTEASNQDWPFQVDAVANYTDHYQRDEGAGVGNDGK